MNRNINAFVYALIILALTLPLFGSTDACEPSNQGNEWLATGIVTRIDGTTVYLLGKDNVVYTVYAGKSEIVFEGFGPEHTAMAVGDAVRVFGKVGGVCVINAERIRVFPPENLGGSGPSQQHTGNKEIKIIIDNQPVCEQPYAPALPCPETPQDCTWQGRGLVSDVAYGLNSFSLITSTGPFRINVGKAQIVSGGRLVRLGAMNPGDAVRISGKLTGLNEIEAYQVRVVRTRFESEGSLPQTPISVLGYIQEIDYDSMTFRMNTETSQLVVSADNNTDITFERWTKAFMDLKPGMKIKMSGSGSLATGYAARHIQIIGVAP